MFEALLHGTQGSIANEIERGRVMKVTIGACRGFALVALGSIVGAVSFLARPADSQTEI